MNWKPIFTPSWGKILFTLGLIFLTGGYVFIVASTVVDFNTNYYEQALSNPFTIIFLLPLFICFKVAFNTEFFPLFFLGIVLQPFYCYFLVCLINFLAHKSHYSSKPPKKKKNIFKPTKYSLVLSGIFTILITLAYLLGTKPGGSFNPVIEWGILILTFPGFLTSIFVSLLFLSSTSLFVDSIVNASVTIIVSIIFWYFVMCIVLALFREFKKK